MISLPLNLGQYLKGEQQEVLLQPGPCSPLMKNAGLGGISRGKMCPMFMAYDLVIRFKTQHLAIIFKP